MTIKKEETSHFGDIFSFADCYVYNSEAIAYIDCILLKDINESIVTGTLISDTIINFKTCKLKFNMNGMIYIIPISIAWNTSDVTMKSDGIEDSDFDYGNESSSSGSDGSDEESDESGSDETDESDESGSDESEESDSEESDESEDSDSDESDSSSGDDESSNVLHVLDALDALERCDTLHDLPPFHIEVLEACTDSNEI